MEQATSVAATELIGRLGGLSEVARAIGVSRQAVSKWQVHGIPPDRWAALKTAFPKAPWRKYAGARGRGRVGKRA